MPVDATTIVGILVGFLVVGVIGIYVGESIIGAANLTDTTSVAGSDTNISQSTIWWWTAPAHVSSVDLTLVGGGGGGGTGNTANQSGGLGGAAGTVATYTVAVTAGTQYHVQVGARGGGGAGGVTPDSGSAGTNTSITIGGVLYDAAGGAGGAAGLAPNGATRLNGTSGGAGYSGTFTPAAQGSPGYQNTSKSNANFSTGGAGGVGYGAGGGGGGVNTTNIEDAGGVGTQGAIKISYATYTASTYSSSLYSSQQDVIATFMLGVLLCKIIVIVSIASIVFMLLQKTGLIPRFGAG